MCPRAGGGNFPVPCGVGAHLPRVVVAQGKPQGRSPCGFQPVWEWHLVLRPTNSGGYVSVVGVARGWYGYRARGNVRLQGCGRPRGYRWQVWVEWWVLGFSPAVTQAPYGGKSCAALS